MESTETAVTVLDRPDWLNPDRVRELMDAFHLDSPQKAAFLLAYAETGNISASARAIGYHRHTHDWWLDHDPDERYNTAFRIAHNWYVDNMEGELRHRGTVGDERRVYYKGQPIAGSEYRIKSDLCLIASLRAEKPDKYRENVHITGSVTTYKEYGFSTDKVFGVEPTSGTDESDV